MIPELQALDARPSVIRIPHQIDVPLTARVKRLVDTDAFRRLSHVSQLGLVSFVYPGATHTRFEHSLGVYRNTLLFLRRLQQDDFFATGISDAEREAVLVAALLHDIGHWPYCHPIEDIGLNGIPCHEDVSATILQSAQFQELIEQDWQFEIPMLVRLIGNKPQTTAEKILGSIISGPIDVDKMDYLYRDSLHCGVPYGMNFDAPRLINSICLNQQQTGIAITSKGKTAAEMLVFARYIMFSEVYWHHAVRSATAMLQRIFFDWHQRHADKCAPSSLSRLTDSSFAELMTQSKDAVCCSGLLDGLFGGSRQLYKRAIDYNAHQNPDIYQALAHQPYERLAQMAEQLAERLCSRLDLKIGPAELLIDAPPISLEVQFKVQINDGSSADSLENISPVVNALAKQQFDDFVKRVRVFVHPELKPLLAAGAVDECLREVVSGIAPSIDHSV